MEPNIIFVSESVNHAETKRNVLIHTKTRDGKADGEPIAAFISEESLKSVKCLKAEMKRVLQDVQSQGSPKEHNEGVIVIDAIYYVPKGKRSFPLVTIVNEDGIHQALKEYPEIQRNGHRSTAILRLACDWHRKGEALQQRFSPRRHHSHGNSQVPNHKIRIEVHAGVNLSKNTADGPIFTLYNVDAKENLNSIKKLVREKVPGACLRAGFYWLPPKQVKPLHTLQSDNDLETAKDAYRDDIMGFVKSLRLATVVESDGERTHNAKRSLAPNVSTQRSKRSHEPTDIESDDDDDAREFDDEALSKFQKTSNNGKSSLKDNNSTWNKIHVELRKSLEETGQINRFGMKHMSLWTDLIQKGEVTGPREEPDWSKYKHIVGVEPMTRNTSSRVTAMSRLAANAGQASGMSDLLTTMLIQQEMRREEERAEAAKQKQHQEMMKLEFERKHQMERQAEVHQQNMFQAMLLQALSPRSDSLHSSTSNASTPFESTNKGLMTKTCTDVCDILKLLNLGHYAASFMEKGIDGSTFSFITEDGLKELGVLSPIDRSKILGYIAREKIG